MTFAKWEKMIRFYDEFKIIHTKLDETGQVIHAWTATDEWKLEE